MKGEISSRLRQLPKPSSFDLKRAYSEESRSEDEYLSDEDAGVSECESYNEDMLSINTSTVSLYQTAAVHIITEKALPKPWFRRTPTVAVEVQELAELVDGLLEAYKEYFDNVVRKEPWCESRGVSDFKKIAVEVLNRDEEKANWTRIAMLLALGTRVAKHFYQKGSSREAVVSFAKAVGLCIQERVNSWEDRGDRWESLRRDAASKPSRTYTPLIGAGAVFVSFLAVVAQFTMTTPVFINRLKT